MIQEMLLGIGWPPLNHCTVGVGSPTESLCLCVVGEGEEAHVLGHLPDGNTEIREMLLGIG